jgi:(R,R)-butanediol dehydrogenase/meso-butanediol dehydrogenase/diacetyl reductase
MGSVNASMRVAVYRGEGRVPVETFSTPVPEDPHDVLVEIAYCGICGTDLHAIVENSGRNGWGAPGFIGGHEWSGRVRVVGDGVTRWKEGDHVTGNFVTCGSCPNCRGGRPSLCRNGGPQDGQGAFSQYMRKNENAIRAVPDGLDLRAAALTEPLAVALHAVTRSGAQPGQRVLVCGAGPIGALTVVALHARGIDRVTVSEPHSLRRALAARLGADAVAPEDLSPVATPGGGTPFEVVIETSGSPHAATAAIDCLLPGGTLVLVGVCTQPANLDLIRILGDELVVTGSALYDVDGMTEALALLAGGQVPVDVLVEPADITLDEVADACARLASGQLAGKVMVVPN